MEREKVIAIRAGIFLLVALIGFGVSIFVLGTKKGYFKPNIILKTTFLNMRGLQEGSPVRLAGVSAGKVKRIIFPEELAGKQIEVEMEINKSLQKRIRRDSVCGIKWLSYVTGDAYIDITVGSSDKPMVEEGGYVNSLEPIDYFTVFEGSLGAFSSVTRTLTKLEETRLIETIAEATSVLKEDIKAIEEGKGILHALIFDPVGHELLDNLIATAKSLRSVTQQVEGGDNLLHTLAYDKEFNERMKSLAQASQRLNNLLEKVETQEGILHALLFDPEKAALLEDLTEVSRNLKAVTEKMARGEGTMGALVHDPGLYESLKNLMGGAERSWLLRRMIQKSIKAGKEREAEGL
ncbi:MAG: MlaD family protein [Candidatus Brocadiales bacterium]|nr:MlaD family protein [Candidatus Brocadiales bacterium]